MIDEKNFQNILNLIENSSLKIKNVKEIVAQRREGIISGTNFVSLADKVSEFLDGKNYDDLASFFASVDEDILARLTFLKEHYVALDETLLKMQNVAKHVDESALEEIENLAKVIGAFLYKIKILQGIVDDLSAKITSYKGDNASVFLKSLMIDCNELDEEFEQLLSELKGNFKQANELNQRLQDADAALDMQEELFGINVGVNTLMSAISVFDKKYESIGDALDGSETYQSLRSDVSSLAVDAKTLSESLQTLNSLVETKADFSEQLLDVSRKLDSFNIELPATQDEHLDEVKEQISLLEEKLESVGSSVENIDFSDLLSSAEDSKEHFNLLNEKIQSVLDTLIHSLEEEASDESSKEIETIRNSVEVLGEKFGAYEVELRSSQEQQLESIDLQIQNFEKRLGSLGELIEASKGLSLDDLREELGSFGAKIEEIHNVIETSQKENVDEVKITTEALMSRVDGLQDNIDASVKSSLDSSLSAPLERLQSDFSGLANKMSDIGDILGLSKQDILSEFKVELQRVVGISREVQSAGIANIEGLKSSVDSFQEHFATLEKNLSENNQGLENFKNELESLESKISGLCNSVFESQDAKQQQIVEKIELLEETIKNSQSERMGALRADFASYGEKLTSLEESLKVLQESSKEDFLESLGSFKASLKGYQQENLDVLKGKVYEFEQKILDEQEDIKAFVGLSKGEIVEKVDALEYDIKEILEEIVESFKYELNSFEQRTQGLDVLLKEAINEAVGGNLDELQESLKVKFFDRVSSMEEAVLSNQNMALENIESLKSDINTFEQKLSDLGVNIEEAQRSKQEEMVQKISYFESSMKESQGSNFESISSELEKFEQKIYSLTVSLRNTQDKGLEDIKASLQNELVTFEQKVESIAFALKGAQSDELEEIKNELFAFDEKIAALGLSIRESNGAGFEDLEEQLRAFDEKISALENNIAGTQKVGLDEIQSVLSQKMETLELSLKGSQVADFENVKEQIVELKDKIENINSLVALLDNADFSEVHGNINRVYSRISELDNTAKLLQLEETLGHLASSEIDSSEKIDYLHQVVSSIDVNKVEEELGSITSDLALLSNEIKKNRMLTGKSVESLQESIGKMNVNELKAKLSEIEAVVNDGFIHSAKQDDLHNFVEGMDYILQKFELFGGFIDSCDDFFLIKEQFVGFEQKIIEIKKGVERIDGAADLKKFINAHHEKLRVLVDALNNTESIIDIKQNTDALMSEIIQTKEVAEGVKAFVESVSFDEYKDSILTLQSTSSDIKEMLFNINDRLSGVAKVSDISALIAMMEELPRDVVREYQLDELKESVAQLPKDVARSYELADLKEAIDQLPTDVARSYELVELKESIEQLPKETLQKSDIERLEYQIDEKSQHLAEKSDVTSAKNHLEYLISELPKDVAKEGDIATIISLVQQIPRDVLQVSDIDHIVELLEELPKDSASSYQITELKSELKSLIQALPEQVSQHFDASAIEESLRAKTEFLADKTDIANTRNYLESLISQLPKEVAQSDDVANIINHINELPRDVVQKFDIKNLEHLLLEKAEYLADKADIAETKNHLEYLINELPKDVARDTDIATLISIIDNLPKDVAKSYELLQVKESIEQLPKDVASEHQMSKMKNELYSLIEELPHYISQELNTQNLENSLRESFENSLDSSISEKTQHLADKADISEAKNQLEYLINELPKDSAQRVDIDELGELVQNTTNNLAQRIDIENLAELIDERTSSAADRDDFARISSQVQDSLRGVAQSSEISSMENSLGAMIQESTGGLVKKHDIENVEAYIEERTEPLAEKTDVVLVNELIKEKSEQLEYLIRVLDHSEEITEIKQSILQSNNAAELEQLGQRLEELLNNQKEARNLLADLNTKDLENALSILSLEQKDMKINLEQLLEIDYVDEVKNVSNLVEEKFEVVDSIRKDVSTIGMEFETLLRQDDMIDTVKNIDDIQFAVKETLSESALIREDVGVLESKIEEFKNLLQYINHKKDFQDVKGFLSNLKDAQEEQKDMMSSLVNVDDVAQLGSLINDNYHEIRMAFENLEPAKQASELGKLLEGLKKDQEAMSATLENFGKNIDSQAFAMIRDEMDASEASIKAYIDQLQAKDDIIAVKTQLETLTQDIAMQMMQIFDNISFEQETQDIKDFVEESELNIKNIIVGLKASVERLLDAPQPVYIDELKSEMDKLSQGVVTLNNSVDGLGPEMSEYIQTIDSIRVSLEDLSNAQSTVKIIEQEMGGLNVDIGEILKLLKSVAVHCEHLYTIDDAKTDFDRVSETLENIIRNQYEQREIAQKDDLKGGIDNVNLSISNINDNLSHFVSDYKGFAERVVETVENLDSVTSHISNIDSINTEYKQGVNESFRLLKGDLESISSKVNFITDDVDRVKLLSNNMLELGNQNKNELALELDSIKDTLDKAEILKIQDGLSNVIFTLTNHINDFEKRYAELDSDSKSVLRITEEGKEICENLKGSMVYMAEWVNSSGKTFSTLQESINSFRASFDENVQGLKSVDEVKFGIENLENTISAQMHSLLNQINQLNGLNSLNESIIGSVNESFNASISQLKDRLESDLLPEMQLRISNSLDEKFAALDASKEQDKRESYQDIKEILNEQIVQESVELKTVLSNVEQNLVQQIQSGVEQISSEELDLTEVIERIESKVSSDSNATQQTLMSVAQSLSENISDNAVSLNTQLQSKLEQMSNETQVSLQNLEKTNDNAQLASMIHSVEDKLVSTISGLDGLMQRLDAKLETQDKKMEFIEDRIKDQDEKVSMLINKIDILTDKVSKAQALDLAEQVITLESRMGSLDENVQKIVSFVEED